VTLDFHECLFWRSERKRSSSMIREVNSLAETRTAGVVRMV